MRKSQQTLEIQDRESDKNCAVIADAVAVSMCAAIDKYIRNEREKEREKEIKKEEEREIKREEEREHWRNADPRTRRHSDSDSQFGASGLQSLRPKLKTENMMQSPSPFLSLFQSPPPLIIKAVQGFPGLRAEAPRSEGNRSTTSERKKVIQEVNHAFSTKSTQSEPDSVDMLIAREKLQTMFNNLAGEDVLNNVDLGSLLKEIVITKKEQ